LKVLCAEIVEYIPKTQDLFSLFREKKFDENFLDVTISKSAGSLVSSPHGHQPIQRSV